MVKHENKAIEQRILNDFKIVKDTYPFFVGFPGSVDFDYTKYVYTLKYLLNNVGDPYESPHHTNHSKSFEREVIDFFADMFRAPKRDRWGYVTNGGTEGNLYGLYVARTLYPDAIVYYSVSAHYSIPKNISILRMESETIQSLASGEMDYGDFRKKVAAHPGKPAIVVATIGTTMTEAKDNIAIIQRVLDECSVTDRYIHCDAALAGIYMSFAEPHYPLDFEDGADSISISGHKFIGSPIPCGIVITRKSHKEKVARDSLYVGAADTTISGSRNGHAPIFLWARIQELGAEGLRERARKSMNLANYLLEELKYIGWRAWMNPMSLTVVIARPPNDIVDKWQLATYGDWSHIICMPGVKKKQIDTFIADLNNSMEK